MRLNNLDPRELSSWVTTLESLASQNQPEIVLSPKAAGIGPEEELGGYQLRSYPKLHLLLQKAPDEATRKFREAYKPELSADEFRKQAVELEEDLPFAIKKRIYVFAESLKANRPAYVDSDSNNAKILEYLNKNKMRFDLTSLLCAFDALKTELELKPTTTHAPAVALTEYEPRTHGAPALPDKASLVAKIRNLSSTDLLKFYQDNPGARAAVDAM
jgi:hypothetical protein